MFISKTFSSFILLFRFFFIMITSPPSFISLTYIFFFFFFLSCVLNNIGNKTKIILYCVNVLSLKSYLLLNDEEKKRRRRRLTLLFIWFIHDAIFSLKRERQKKKTSLTCFENLFFYCTLVE